MKSIRVLVVTAVTAFAVGISAGAVIEAQQTHAPRGYVIAEVNVKDPVAFKKYSSQVPDTLKPFGGEFLVRGGRTLPLEGPPPGQRVVVLSFDSVEKAQAWYNSPAYSALRPIRQQAAEAHNFIVEGVPPAP